MDRRLPGGYRSFSEAVSVALFGAGSSPPTCSVITSFSWDVAYRAPACAMGFDVLNAIQFVLSEFLRNRASARGVTGFNALSCRCCVSRTCTCEIDVCVRVNFLSQSCTALCIPIEDNRI